MLSEALQRRFIMLLCLRCANDSPLTDDEIAFQMRITPEDWSATKAVFVQKAFMDADNNVLNWDSRQFVTGGQGGEPTSKSSNYVYFVADRSQFVGAPDSYVVKIGISKNPWARVKELQTGNDKPIEIIASFRADTISDSEIHTILAKFRTTGEWFKLPPNIALSVVEHSKAKEACYESLRSLIVELLRSTPTVATKTTTDTEADTESETESETNVSVVGAKALDCPHQEIIALYNRILPELEQVLPSRWAGARAKHLQARWRESPKHQRLEFWERFFAALRELPFYLGENNREWRANLGWIVKRENFDKLIEKLTDNARRAQHERNRPTETASAQL